ncbi:hypothetical protein GCM10010330_41600 [Streptomyces tendae]|uniref:hypothetical protein n=1 Tax=Streptomyces tendae TaxID=1932 RepID=UPI0016790B23|nr:hypothetical protein [Streptomyces tendae]GHA82926.1 hypothetical protein GCM10010330_41600 [Streptomyces tendae]
MIYGVLVDHPVSLFPGQGRFVQAGDAEHGAGNAGTTEDQAQAGVVGGSVGWDRLLPAQAWMLENQTGSDEAFSAKTDKAT